MRIVSLTFEKKWNLGDYNSEMLNASAVVDENENASEVLTDLITFVKSKGRDVATGGDKTPVGATKESTSETVTKAAPTETKEAAPAAAKEKTKPAKEKKEKVSEAKQEETKNVESESKNSEEKSGEEKAVEKKQEPKSQKVKGATLYDPNVGLHKKLMGELLDKATPTWRTNTGPYKEVSAGMAGLEFLDSEGLILESFKLEYSERASKIKR